MQPPKFLTPLRVSADTFLHHKTRIEKDLRIAADLKAGGQRARMRLEELHGIEDLSFRRPLPAGIHREETFVYAYGWKENRVRITYMSPEDQMISEDIIRFSSRVPSKAGEYLSCTADHVTGPPHIPAPLFDARLISRKHAVPAPHRKCEIRMIPRVDGRGAYLGVYSVMIDTR